MKLASLPRAALDMSLRLTRAPAGAMIDLISDAGARPLAAAQRIVDCIDSHARSLLGLSAGDREMREPPSEPPAPAPRRPPSHDEIAARAFELYEQGVPGDPEAHWQAAERELNAAHDA